MELNIKGTFIGFTKVQRFVQEKNVTFKNETTLIDCLLPMFAWNL